MVLESTVICCDNSDYQRNQDYQPSRLAVQKDAINVICISKKRSNPENDIALLTMSNKVEVLSTLSPETSKVYRKLNTVEANGQINFLTALRIAHMILRHRQGKNHRMRIVAFVGSPLNPSIVDDLTMLGKKLKKEKVSIDVISFGQHNDNEDILTEFINTLNGKDGEGSNFLEVPRGELISDALVNSSILVGEDGRGAVVLESDEYQFGFDPETDPDLALALRISMEEEARRRRNEQQQNQTSELNQIVPSDPDEPLLESELINNMTEEQQIAYALRMSLRGVTDDTEDLVSDERSEAYHSALSCVEQPCSSNSTASDSATSSENSKESRKRKSKDSLKRWVKKRKRDSEK